MPASQLAICTIATRSHLALARTMLESARAAMPGAALYLLLVDSAAPPELESAFAQFPEARILQPQQVTGAGEFADLLARYTAAEVCFALKPALLQHLLGEGHAQVHYLDSDIWLLGALDRPMAQLDGNALLVTPHLLRARALEDGGAGELGILRAGTFNAGYIAVTPLAQSLGILGWWRDRVRRWGYNEPRLGMCGDQRWLDPVPYLFGKVVVCGDPGINVGYWRAPLMRLERHGDEVLIEGQPLTMLHLSGFDPRRPESFSRYASTVVANTVDDGDAGRSIVTDVLRRYAERLLANDWEADRQHGYPHYRWWHGSSLPVRLLRAGALALRQRRGQRAAS